MRIVRVNWITAHNCGRPKWHSFASSLSWTEIFWGATILSDKMGPRKQTTEPNLLILVSFFSGEVTPYTDNSYCIHMLWEVCRSVCCCFLGGKGVPRIDISKTLYVKMHKVSVTLCLNQIDARHCINQATFDKAHRKPQYCINVNTQNVFRVVSLLPYISHSWSSQA